MLDAVLNAMQTCHFAHIKCWPGFTLSMSIEVALTGRIVQVLQDLSTVSRMGMHASKHQPSQHGG